MEQFQEVVDETMLQLELAEMDARDEVAKMRTSAENAWLAAGNRATQMSKELFGGVRAMWEGADRAFAELRYLPVDTVRALRRH